MFGGSVNIPVYDEAPAAGRRRKQRLLHQRPHQLLLPVARRRTRWKQLSGSRATVLSLAFSKKSPEVQRKVVCEEFKEHYINKALWRCMA